MIFHSEDCKDFVSKLFSGRLPRHGDHLSLRKLLHRQEARCCQLGGGQRKVSCCRGEIPNIFICNHQYFPGHCSRTHCQLGAEDFHFCPGRPQHLQEPRWVVHGRKHRRLQCACRQCHNSHLHCNRPGDFSKHDFPQTNKQYLGCGPKCWQLQLYNFDGALGSNWRGPLHDLLHA